MKEEISIINNFSKYINKDKNINRYLNNKNSDTNKKYFLDKEIDQLFLKTIKVNPEFYKKTNEPRVKDLIKNYLISEAMSK